MSKYLLSILFIIFFINSCDLSQTIEKKCITKKKSDRIFLNFDLTVENIVLEILKSNNILILNNTLFFIDLLENTTNVVIDREKLTNLIKNKFSKNSHKINFLKNKIIEKNKKKLGVLTKKNTLDTSTAILLSRNNNVKYYLHSRISGEKKPFLLIVELILVKTGEIIFMKKERFYW